MSPPGKSGEPPRVGVLSLHNSKETKAILNAIESLGHEPVWLRDENIRVNINARGPEFNPPVDIVVNRLLLSTAQNPLEGLGLAYAYRCAVPVLNDPTAVGRALNKIAIASILAANGVPVPDSLCTVSHRLLNRHRSTFEQSAVYKTSIGTHGEAMRRVDPSRPIDPWFGAQQMFLQQFIHEQEGEHRDRRVYVVGDRVIGAMDRYAPDDDWRTNIARGGEPVDVSAELSTEVAELAVRAVDVLKLDYAGVDLIHDGENWFVLEVNPTAGFKGLFEATGVSAAPHIAKLALDRIGDPIPGSAVTALEPTLDDTIPDCKPVLEERTDPLTIGFTEQVVVSGHDGGTRVAAKADTGADRTSLDFDLAAAVGAGPITDTVSVRSSGTQERQRRPVVEVVIGIRGEMYQIEADLEDRNHMDYQLLLGRDVLTDYAIDMAQRVEE